MKTVAELAHETMREIDKTEIEARERMRIYRAKISKLKAQLTGLIHENPDQQVDDGLLAFGGREAKKFGGVPDAGR